MEVNTVCLSLEIYDELNEELRTTKSTCQKLLEENDELDTKVEELLETQSYLVECIIKSKVSEYRLKSRTLEQLVDVNSYTFALDKEDLDELLYTGITIEQIIDEIAILKHNFDATKGETEDGNE